MPEAKPQASFDAVIEQIVAIEDRFETLQRQLDEFETWSMLKPKLSQKRREKLNNCKKEIELFAAVKTRYQAAQSAQRAQSFPLFKAHIEHEEMKVASYFVLMRSQAIEWLSGFVKKMHWMYLQETKDKNILGKFRSPPFKQLTAHKSELSKSIQALSRQTSAIETEAARLIYDNPSISDTEDNNGSSIKLAAELFKLEEQLDYFNAAIEDATKEQLTNPSCYDRRYKHEDNPANVESAIPQARHVDFDFIGIRRYESTKEQLKLAQNFIRQTLVRMTENDAPSLWE